jgi:hydroxymethylpyrimidine/phosphomethylpyrimidine kinase
MSSILEYITNNPQETQRLVGLKLEQLQNLINQAKILHNRKQADIESNKVRIIAKGGGRTRQN